MSALAGAVAITGGRYPDLWAASSAWSRRANDTARRAMVHQANLPMHVHDAVFNEDFTTLYAVGHNKIAVVELRS